MVSIHYEEKSKQDTSTNDSGHCSFNTLTTCVICWAVNKLNVFEKSVFFWTVGFLQNKNNYIIEITFLSQEL